MYTRFLYLSLSLTKHNALPAPRVPDSISVITRERADFPDTPASLKDTRFKPLTLSLSLSHSSPVCKGSRARERADYSGRVRDPDRATTAAAAAAAAATLGEVRGLRGREKFAAAATTMVGTLPAIVVWRERRS